MEKMREEFEIQYLMHVCLYSRERAVANLDMHREEAYLTRLSEKHDFRYCHNATHDAWWAWQASRAAQCVELPDSERSVDCGDVLYRSDVEEALDAAGIRYT